ncbi:MAG: DUF1800 domain-containing protein [Planktomarina sp.]
MRIDPTLGALRFGTGLRPGVVPPRTVENMLTYAQRDAIAREFQLPLHGGESAQINLQTQLLKEHRQNKRAGLKDTPEGQATHRALGQVNAELRRDRLRMLANTVARGVHTDHGLTERLVWFWADHFTAQGKTYRHEAWAGDYLDRAIRPHVLGRFEDMLAAAITHPMMLHYLDQSASIGPNSRKGGEDSDRGINENLAREVLELHTLGVGGPYTQGDVQALAAALTGWTEKLGRGTTFKLNQAEPGPFTIMGQTYGTAKRSVDDLLPLARDLARHPVTAHHIARKMAVHFVADTPSDDLVRAMTDSYLASDGDLLAVTDTMLRHPESWAAEMRNIKWPLEYVTAALRSLGLPAAVMHKMKPRRIVDLLESPLRKMGQGWQKASGPDGLAEADDRWITPQGLAARLEWALSAPDQLLVRVPDPRQVLTDALGDTAPQSLRFAVDSASLRKEGIALIFASPAFQRR